MPWEKGHKPMGGRKGYEYELKEMERMKKILSKYFLLVEKIELTDREKERFTRLEKAALKIMDKRHANKLDLKHEGEINLPTPILKIDVQPNDRNQQNTETIKED